MGKLILGCTAVIVATQIGCVLWLEKRQATLIAEIQSALLDGIHSPNRTECETLWIRKAIMDEARKRPDLILADQDIGACALILERER
jgi:hypothetical protein